MIAFRLWVPQETGGFPGVGVIGLVVLDELLAQSQDGRSFAFDEFTAISLTVGRQHVAVDREANSATGALIADMYSCAIVAPKCGGVCIQGLGELPSVLYANVHSEYYNGRIIFRHNGIAPCFDESGTCGYCWYYYRSTRSFSSPPGMSGRENTVSRPSLL